MTLLLLVLASPFAAVGLATIARGIYRWRAERAFERSIRQVNQQGAR